MFIATEMRTNFIFPLFRSLYIVHKSPNSYDNLTSHPICVLCVNKYEQVVLHSYKTCGIFLVHY